MTAHSIETRQLNFYYSGHKVLKDINLSFKRYHISAIIGPSGSGKSTLLRCFNRIYELYPTLKAEGQIRIDDKNILEPGTNLNELRARVGMVFQKPTPFPMSIYDNIAFALKLHEKLSKAEVKIRVEKALRQAALWDEVKNKLHDAGTHLSGGQQQRLCIARTIAINPEILLLDEPTSALDPIATAKIEQLILELKEKFTIIMVTHNMKQAQRISDETVFMRQGEVIEFNNTEKLFTSPAHPETAAYIADH
jgi:phosphate transport system ATP-binding protein